MNPRRLLEKEWKTVENLIAATCRRRGALEPADADAFATMVKLKLFENDCEIVRRFRGESRFSTYLATIVQNTFGDFCTKRFGKWHASAAAIRRGAIGVELERLVHREGCPPDEAIARMQSAHPGIHRGELTEILSELRARPRRMATVSLDAMSADVPNDSRADILVIENDLRHLSDRVASVVRSFLESLENNDRLLLQLHFESSMDVARIARILRVPSKPLYRRREQLLRDLRKALMAEGITSVEIRDLVGHVAEELDFGLRNAEFSPTDTEEGVTPHPEIPT
jgi:RNA polymerase sigma factor (sigma-70 family)